MEVEVGKVTRARAIRESYPCVYCGARLIILEDNTYWLLYSNGIDYEPYDPDATQCCFGACGQKYPV